MAPGPKCSKPVYCRSRVLDYLSHFLAGTTETVEYSHFVSNGGVSLMTTIQVEGTESATIPEDVHLASGPPEPPHAGGNDPGHGGHGGRDGGDSGDTPEDHDDNSCPFRAEPVTCHMCLRQVPLVDSEQVLVLTSRNRAERVYVTLCTECADAVRAFRRRYGHTGAPVYRFVESARQEALAERLVQVHRSQVRRTQAALQQSVRAALHSKPAGMGEESVAGGDTD